MRVSAPPSSSPTARTWRPVLALGAWSAFVWLTRIRNALGDDEMTSGGRAIALLTAIAFLAGAGALVWAHRAERPWARRATAAFAVVTSVYWVLRMGTIVVRDHSLGFTVVHGLLGAVFLALSAWAVRAAGGGPTGPAPGRTPV